ncbi:MAG: hypothetical protein ACYTGN_18570 [Planctomycetota bacterium]
MIEFAQPFGFWLGLAAAGVLTAHLVRRRAKRQVVPFLPLWTVLLEGRRGGFGSRVVRHLDLVLVLLASIAVALAAGMPFLRGTPSTVRDLVLVLDGGIELRASDRRARMRAAANDEIRRRGRGTRIVVVAAGDEGPAVWSGSDRNKAFEFVREHQAGWLAADATEALALASGAAKGLRDADLVFCTARPLAPEGFRMRRFGGPIRNAGIVSLEVLADPEGRGRIARVGLEGDGPAELGGFWKGTLDGAETVDVALPPGGRVTLDLKTGKDEFWPDNRAVLIVPQRKLPRVLVVAEGAPSAFLAAALQALEKTGVILGPLGRTTPDHALAAARAYDVLIFDRSAPSERIPAVRALFLAPPQAATLPFKVGAKGAAPALFELATEHPLLSGVDFARIPPREAAGILGGEALARAATGPALAAGPGWIALGFDADKSVLASSPSYPLFLRNCIALLADVLPAQTAEFYAIGERAPASGMAAIEGRGPVRIGDRLIGAPGFWSMGGRALAVNLLHPGLDLRGPDKESDPLPEVGDAGYPDRPVTGAFAAAAVLFLLVAWWIFWR